MVLVGLTAVLVGCTPAAVEDPPPVSPDPAPTTSTATTTVSPSSAAVISHDDHLVPDTGPPVGLLPSFNESPGCAAPQGVRGPYADRAGSLRDHQVVSGPWGDFFGRTVGDVRDSLVLMELPNPEGVPPVLVYVHERVVPALQVVIDTLLLERDAGRSYRIDPRSTFSFSPATVPPRRYFSFHAVGAAIDVNATANPYRDDNELITDMPEWFVRAWTDAGWCWGGDWQSIKDPMHFSWQGPRFTAGYSIPARIPPTTPTGSFSRAVTVPTGLGPDPGDSSLAIADVDRDGAVDAVRITRLPAPGTVEVLAARAIHRFDTCLPLGPTPDRADRSVVHLLADRTGDARPDLWAFAPSAAGATVTVFTFDTSYTKHLAAFEIPVALGPTTILLLGDHDLDGMADLHVVRTGAESSVVVRGGPTFTAVIAEAPLEGVGAGWRFALGLRDSDRVPDLFALSPDGPIRLAIFGGADGFSDVLERVDVPGADLDGQMAAQDFDGDGHADLLLLGADGTLTVFLGGERRGVSDQGLMSWFLAKDDHPWEYRDGCPTVGRLPR